MFETGNRVNKSYVEPLVIQTLAVLEVLAANVPQPGTAAEISEITSIPIPVCQKILISLAFDGWIRETEDGFQTLGQAIKRLDGLSHRVLDESFQDMGQAIPRIRKPNGYWHEPAPLNSCAHESRAGVSADVY